MALETVDIYVKTDDLVPIAVDDVVVRVYDEAGTTLITSGTTSDPAPDGHVEFTLDGDVDPTPVVYQLRFYKSGVSFSSPQLIEVYSPPADSPTGTNTFEVVAHVYTLPEAVDPLLCRASSYFVWPDGRPHKGLSMHFIYAGYPQRLNARGVFGERVAIRTDATGYAQVDLIRGACYHVTVESDENTQRVVVVPDAAGINLVHLLYPLIDTIVWTVPGAMSLGTAVVLEPEVYSSNLAVLDGAASDDLLYEVDDPAIISVLVSTESITLTALAVGTTTLRVTRRDATIAYLPDAEIVGGTAVITVS